MVPASTMTIAIPDLSHTITVSPEVLEQLNLTAPPIQPSESMLKGAPPTMFGMPVIVSEFLPSWIAATVGVPGKTCRPAGCKLP